MARKKHPEHEEHVNHERWLVSYADMVTLLMCVFIVLFAMATVDQRKFEALKDSLSGHTTEAPSVLEGEPSLLDGGEPQLLDTTASARSPEMNLPEQQQAAARGALATQNRVAAERKREQDNFEQVRKEIQAELDARGLGDLVQFRREPTGLVVTIVTDKVLFELGKADVRNEGKFILDALIVPLSHLENPVTVEGHTDNVPITGGGPYPTNWELSAARSISVLRYMVEQKHFPSNRVSAAGYADQRPVVPNDTAEHRAQNRRVEVVVRSLLTDSNIIASASAGTTGAASGATGATSGVTSEPNSEESHSSGSDESFDLPTLPEKPKIDLPAPVTTEEQTH